MLVFSICSPDSHINDPKNSGCKLSFSPEDSHVFTSDDHIFSHGESHDFPVKKNNPTRSDIDV